jgi:hypothetical protein
VCGLQSFFGESTRVQNVPSKSVGAEEKSNHGVGFDSVAVVVFAVIFVVV